MDSVPLRTIRKKTDEYDAKLLATDPRFRRSVTMIHQDGSYLHFDSAFLMRTGDWIACFTEHHGTHVYHYEDLQTYWESEVRRDAIEEMP